MIKKIALILSIVALLVSCKPNVTESDNQVDRPKDSTIVGADKDENGCLASAGYTWSKLNKECVRIFTGIQLLPIDKTGNPDDAVLATYVLFNESGDKAEVFFPDEKSIILTRNAEGKPWIFNEYELVPWKGYILKKEGKTLYAGDGEVGNKVMGSDTEDSE